MLGISVLSLWGCKHEQRLPFAVTVDASTRELQWSDAGGSLDPEVPWVLRTDALGPDTYLIAETSSSGRQCVKRVFFRVIPIPGIEVEVRLTSDLEGRISWDVRYSNGKQVTLRGCTPRSTGDPRECLGGGIPKTLFGKADGPVRAKPAGGGSTLSIETLRFEQNPPEC